MRSWLLYPQTILHIHAQRALMLIMLGLLGFFGPLACVLHCSLMPSYQPMATVRFVCQFGHAEPSDMSQGQVPMPHVSLPGLLPFAQLTLPGIVDLLGIYTLLMLLCICMGAQLGLPPPTPPPRLFR